MPVLGYPIDENAVAFNAGSDARVKGWAVDTNPFDAVQQRSRYRAWKAGWWDVNEHYGEWVEGRWPVRPLKAVQGEVSCT